MGRYGVQKVVQKAPNSPNQVLAPLDLHTPQQLL